MPREEFQKQIKDALDSVLEMSSHVDRALDRAMQSLIERDVALAQTVIDGDSIIDELNYETQDEVLKLLAQQAPLATDLRIIVSVSSVMIDLERMGDHAEGIARITITMQDEPLVKPLIDLPIMASKARDMLRNAVEAFVDADPEKAYAVNAADDEVDAIYDRVYEELIDIMVADPQTISPSTHLQWVSHNIERIADRATNIAERAVYSATGVYPRDMNVSNY